jgi:hypothetical protein
MCRFLHHRYDYATITLVPSNQKAQPARETEGDRRIAKAVVRREELLIAGYAAVPSELPRSKNEACDDARRLKNN